MAFREREREGEGVARNVVMATDPQLKLIESSRFYRSIDLFGELLSVKQKDMDEGEKR